MSENTASTSEQSAAEVPVDVPPSADTSAVAPSPGEKAPTTDPASASSGADSSELEVIKQGYTFEGAAIELGVVMENDEPQPEIGVRIPLGMLNRHGLIAGATGTGKTVTLQLLTEQISAAGVPVVAADVKGDLSGLASPGVPSDKLTKRTEKIGQQWEPKAAPTQFFALGGKGIGVPLRATVSSFGPVLLSKVLGLNETQEQSLGLVFHYADSAGLPLLDLSDLQSLMNFLTSDEGKPELKNIGGLSTATAGVILRAITTFAAEGADQFFGEPEFDTTDLLQVGEDGRGLVSLVELPTLATQPALFSTFLMWLLADLFQDLPEVGDSDKPKLVFFFDEAHLLFNNASKAFLDSITQTVRLIRSKGVGVFFVTQTPKDVPDDVLAQLGSRVQHQLRAHTPNDAKALKQTVATYPKSHYDLGAVLQELGIGEAVVTVMDPDGAPTPVAWTRMRAPLSLMAPTPEAEMKAAVDDSALMGKYGEAIDRESAREMLAKRLEDGAEHAAGEPAGAPAPEQGEPRREEPKGRQKKDKSFIEQVSSNTMVRQIGRTAVREVMRGLFGTGRRRR